MFWKSEPGTEKLNQKLPSTWTVEELGLLGQGGMSRVFRVKDRALGRQIALKLMRQELLKEPAAVQRFVQEATITAQLDHPNIPPVYAFASEAKKLSCFTMKVLEGVSLQQMIEKGGTTAQTLLASLEVMLRVCDAIAFAHSKGVLHLDLKPANVMVAEHGQIYVVDWGLARRKTELPSKDKDDKTSIGTPAYMAPEQARGENHALDERTDIFALGGMLYRVLVGRPPYVGSTAEETLALAQKAVVVPLEQLAPPGNVPSRLASIAMKALNTEPGARYASVVELRHDLEDFVHGTARLPELTFQTGEAIVREGEAGDRAYIIHSGRCEASRGEGNEKVSLRQMGPGEMFGEAAVLTGGTRMASVTALEPTTVAVVDRGFLEEEMERSTLIALAIKAVAATVLGMNAEKTGLRALSDALLELAQHGTQEVGHKWVPFKPLEAKLCELHGLSPEALEKALTQQKGLLIDRKINRLILDRG